MIKNRVVSLPNINYDILSKSSSIIPSEAPRDDSDYVSHSSEHTRNIQIPTGKPQLPTYTIDQSLTLGNRTIFDPILRKQPILPMAAIHFPNRSQDDSHQLKQKDYTPFTDQSDRRRPTRRPKSYRRSFSPEKSEKQQFNNTTYCVAYCTILIIGKLVYFNTCSKTEGVTIGGWIGGLFELITSGHNGCTDGYRGAHTCAETYKSADVITECVNLFYVKSMLNIAPYICLCRFRNNSHGKYRQCEFLHAKIDYI